MKEKCYCSWCHKEIYRYSHTIKKYAYHFCSKECQRKLYSIILSGERNGNYGHKWDQKLMNKVSKIVKLRYKKNPELRKKCGANKGKKLPETSKKLREFYKTHTGVFLGKKHSEKTKNIIGIKSRKKFTADYKKKQRTLFEEKGLWIKLSCKSDWEIYKKESNWKQKMFDLVLDPQQLELLKTYGVFNSYTNIKGVVRDHMYSRKSGFLNKVFPEILRHPANCQIITHADNARKGASKKISSDAITLSNLFERILAYKGHWDEQEIVEKKINDYKKGLRWKNPYRIEK